MRDAAQSLIHNARFLLPPTTVKSATLCAQIHLLCDTGIRHCSAAPSRKWQRCGPLLSPNRLCIYLLVWQMNSGGGR